MPDRDVRTLQDLIWYQYAKIIARSALRPDAKQEHYGFVKQTLRDLQSGKKEWSDIAREEVGGEEVSQDGIRMPGKMHFLLHRCAPRWEAAGCFGT
jgi:hypothetical protein